MQHANVQICFPPAISFVNSQARRKFDRNFTHVISVDVLCIKFKSTSCEMALRGMLQNSFDDMSTLVQVTDLSPVGPQVMNQTRTPHIPLPNRRGQVKLPSGQVDFSKVSLYILFKQIEKWRILEVGQGKNFCICRALQTNYDLSSVRSCDTHLEPILGQIIMISLLNTSVAYRYRKSISIIELFVSIYIDTYRVLGN